MPMESNRQQPPLDLVLTVAGTRRVGASSCMCWVPSELRDPTSMGSRIWLICHQNPQEHCRAFKVKLCKIYWLIIVGTISNYHIKLFVLDAQRAGEPCLSACQMMALLRFCWVLRRLRGDTCLWTRWLCDSGAVFLLARNSEMRFLTKDATKVYKQELVDKCTCFHATQMCISTQLRSKSEHLWAPGTIFPTLDARCLSKELRLGGETYGD